MKKYPKIKRLGHRDNEGLLSSDHIRVQEKMDGANFRFTLARNVEGVETNEPKIIFGSRNVVYKNEKDIANSFVHAVDYVRKNINLDTLVRLDLQHGPLTFFGEAMHSHTLDYEWDKVPSFLGYDVWSGENNSVHGPEFFSDADVEWVYGKIGLPTVPMLYYGKPGNFDVTDIPDSQYRDGIAEGVTIKSQFNEQMAKVRSEKFKEMHASGGSSNPEGDDPDHDKQLAQKFTTEARVLKMIHKYENRGEEIHMGMMEDLWRDVFDDVIDEEYDTIFHGNYQIDTHDFRSNVASRTASILDTYLSRPDDSVLNEAPA